MKWLLFRSIIFPYSVNIFITNFWNLYLVNCLFILLVFFFFSPRVSLPLSFESSSSAFLFLLNILCLCQFRWISYYGPEGVFFCGRTSIHINVSSAFGENLNLTWTSAAFPQSVPAAITLVEVGLDMVELQPAVFLQAIRTSSLPVGLLSTQWPRVGSDPKLLMWKSLGPVLCLLCPLKVMVSFCLF